MAIGFSTNLRKAIRQEIENHAHDLGDQLDGVEEIVGDNLSGIEREEWSALIEEHGFEKVTQAVKARFL